MKRGASCAALAIMLGGSGCSSGSEPQARADELTGNAKAALMQAPPNVRCVTIQVSNSSASVTQSFDVSPQENTSFALTGLPFGSDVFLATASTATCGDAGAQPVAYQSMPTTATVAQNTIPTVSLVMQAVANGGPATVGVSFPMYPAINLYPLPTPFNERAIAEGPDGNLWVALFSNSTPAALADMSVFSGPTTMIPIPTNFTVIQAITSGPDGNVWLTGVANLGTDASANLEAEIVRMAPDGTGQTVFPIASATSSRLSSITTGPDGELWVGDTGQNAILHVSTQGVLLGTIPVPTASARPFGITVGSDGNLWFAEAGSTKVGQLNPNTSTIVETALNGAPFSIAAGADGNLYATVAAPAGGSPSIARIAPSGGPVAYFNCSSTPTYITPGPDGNVWFLETSAFVAHIQPDGGIVEIPAPQAGGGGIAAASDGNIYFGAGNQIGRINRY
jgi:virginiamycin B lyase